MRILVVRNDKIGDFMLVWPALRAIKEQFPEAEITALVPGYTQPLAELCPWIDRVLIDPGPHAGVRTLAALFAVERFDASVTFFSTARVAAAAWLARIPYRLAPATKWFQILYTARLTQRRSRSEKPEWLYNVDLSRRFLADHQVATGGIPQPPFLQFPAAEVAALRAQFCRTHALDPAGLLVFVHAGSGGSAVNISPAQYAQLLLALDSSKPLTFVITSGPGEQAGADDLAGRLASRPHAVLAPEGLNEFARHIAFADLWISGSTGPLHIAGSLNRPTAAFYPRRRSATALRWQTVNTSERRLAFSPPLDAGELDMGAIDLDAAAREISARFLR